MLKKIKLLDYTEELVKGEFVQVVNTNKITTVLFNPLWIIRTDILNLDKKVVWQMKLFNGETLFSLPFKL